MRDKSMQCIQIEIRTDQIRIFLNKYPFSFFFLTVFILFNLLLCFITVRFQILKLYYFYWVLKARLLEKVGTQS